ncbi:hypothetical protein E2562_011979, partial [Oryza meyeriana var. granulata]
MTMLLLLGLAVLALQPPQIAAAAQLPPPWCPRTCGGVGIEYPFGVGPICSLSDGFSLECVDDTPQLRLGGAQQEKVEVLGIDVLRGKIRATNAVSWQCLDERTGRIENSTWTGLDAAALPYRVSDEDNRLVTIGGVFALLVGSTATGSGRPVFTTCLSAYLGNGTTAMANGSCSGVGCCEMQVPRGLFSYRLTLANTSAYSAGNNRCSYAVVMEIAGFRFEVAYARTDEFYTRNNGRVPVVLNFAAGNEMCKDARKRRRDTTYACLSDHSVCVDTLDGPGYVCNCSRGYTGNPYLPHGCIGVSGGLVIVVISIMITYLVRQRRALADVKRNYFERHGGRLLYEELSSRQGNAFTIYTEEQLEQATNGFDDSNVLGRSGHATVFKGRVPTAAASAGSDLVVAIKRCKVMDERNKKEFGKEMLILSQVNHKNIVKLLGCCLEVDVPMLVYEYVPNGTLYQLIHGGGSAAVISFATRLRIAHESAESLAYLHSFASPPILHGDVKSSNILLDETFMAKVSDFGASILAPTDEAQLVTMVQGTCGYLDPEYMQTCQLTEKSDVYSFAVVLLELLTGKKPLCLDGPEEERSLSARFVAAMREKRVDEILDEQ